MKGFFILILLGALGVAFFWERAESARLRAANETLLLENQEAGRLAAENAELSKLRTTAPVIERSDTTELLRLRNQAGQLRGQQLEAEKLRAANQRLADEIQSGKFKPRRLADVEGSIPREKWAFAGFATPEATVQSFLTAIASGDPQQLMGCMSPKDAESMRQELERDPDVFRKRFDQEFGKLNKLSAFRIAGTRPKGPNPDRIEVLVQFVADGEPTPLPLRRVGNEWKLGD
ncbi:MAG: hypothetical protein QOF48_245 [Verrucomicrobiota bacterium]|jgi:hypothetical protein